MKWKNLWRGLCALLTLVMLLSGAAAFGQPASAAGEELTLEQTKELLKGEADMTVAEYAEKLKEFGMEVDLAGMDPNASIRDYIQYAPEEKRLEEQMQETGKMTISPGTEHEAVVELSGFAKTTQEQPEEPTAFSDVPQSKWYYETITKMTQRGLFTGVGNGLFAPEKTMNRAEFMTVITRLLFQEELDAMPAPQGQPWWAKNYKLAMKYGLLTCGELESGQLDRPITRQEMAMLCVRACAMQNELPRALAPASAIADLDEAHMFYKDYIRQAHALGLVGGINEQGDFAPNKTLTRAEGCTVLCRLVYPEERLEVQLLPEGDDSDYQNWVVGNRYRGQVSVLKSVKEDQRIAFDGNGGVYDLRTGLFCGTSYHSEFVPKENQTWKEGEPHAPAQVGDTVIKADGTRVVLELGPGHLLGFGQGVDIVTGTTINGYTAKVGDHSWYEPTSTTKCPITGEVYNRSEWIAISSWCWPQDVKGAYEGEIRNTYYQWNYDGWEYRWEWIGPMW